MSSRHFAVSAVSLPGLFTAVAALAALGAPACSGSSLPGAELGTYHVSATLQSNTCGDGPGAPSPWVFDVQLSRDATTLYWSWQNGAPPVSGTLDAALEKATITGSQTQDAGGDGKTAACSVERDDSMAVALVDGSGAPPTFGGTITYSFAVKSGSCAAALTASGGTYDALPCAISYTVDAKRK